MEKNKKRKRKTAWFVHPLDAHTNEVIAKHLARTSDVEEATSLEVEGKKVDNLYELPSYGVLALFFSHKESLDLKFKAYYRQGPYYAKVHEWKFGEGNHKKRKKAVA